MVLQRLRRVRDLLAFDRKRRPFVRPRPDGTVRHPLKLRPWLEVLEDRLVPATFYVDDNFSGGAIADADLGTNGNQPATFGTDAFNTIGAALAASAAADTIIVNSGTYSEAVNLTGTRILRITGPDVPGAVTIGSLTGVAGTTVQIVGSSALTIGDATSTTFSGTISGGGSLTKVGGGTLTLAGATSYTGATTVSAGTLTLSNQLLSSPTLTIASGATLEYAVPSGSLTQTALTIKGTGTIQGTTGTLRKSGAGQIIFGGASTVNWQLGVGGVIDVQQGQMIGGNNNNDDWSSNQSDLNIAAGATFSGVEANLRINALTGAGTLESGWNTNPTITLGVANGTGTFTGIIADTSGFSFPASIVKTGTGTQTLTGASTYTGSTTINGGVLSVAILESGGGPSSIGQSSNAASNLVLNGGTLEYTGGSYFIDRSITVNNTTGGALSVANASTYLAVTGAVLSSASADATLTKTGAGTLSLGGTADNAFLHLVVNAGQVDLAKINSVSSHAANNVTVNAAGTVRLAGTGGDQIFSNVTDNGGTFDLNGRSEVLAGLVLNGGSVIGSGSVTSDSTYEVRSGTISAVLAGSVGLTKTTSGTVTLSGANTYTGVTTVSASGGAGTLVAASAAALGSTAAGTTVASGTTLDVRATLGTEAVSLAGNGVGNNGALVTGSGSGTVTGAVTLTTAARIGGAGDLTITGAIGGGFALAKVGSGTTTLGGTNNYSGTTTLGAPGTLLVTGSLTSAPTVLAGATLGGTGSVAAAVTVNGSLAPGSGGSTTGLLSVGSLSFGAGSVFRIDLNGTTVGSGYDQLIATGTVNLNNATLNVSVGAGFNPAVGTTFTILNNAGTISGNFTNGTVIVANGYRFTINTLGGDGNDVVLTVTQPGVTINQAAEQIDPTNALPITFDVVFTEPVTGFDATDLVRSGTATGGTLNVTVSGATSYEVTLTGAVTPGTVTLAVAAGAAVDGDGNATLASTSTDNTVTYDTAAPTVTINQAAGQNDPATPGPVQFTIVFSEAVTGFTAADVSLAGSTAPGPLVAAVSGSGTTYTVTVSQLTGPGTVVAVVVAGAAQDAAGNPSLASTSTDNSVTVVGTAVTVVNPAANSHTAPVGTNIQATFDQALNPATVTDANFVVHGMQTGRLEAADGDIFGVSGATITVNPFANFHAGELVQVTATGSLLGGGNPAFPRVWQFRTAAAGTSTDTFNNFQILANHSTQSVALGDVDGDGDLDAFQGNFNQASRVWRNDSGTFTLSQTLSVHNTRSVALGDVDGDGDLDAFMGNDGQVSVVWKNNGGTFTLPQTLTSHSTSSVALGDVDGDGDLDAFMGNRANQASIVWKNDGNGTFTLSQTLPTGHQTYSVALGDVDGDGDLDAFIGNFNQASIVWKNDGTGIFSSFQTLTSLHDTFSVALGDVDGDGDLDAFMGNLGGQENLVWKNDGSGTFSSFQPLPSLSTRSVALGDVDGDGDLDAFLGNIGFSRVWKNDGNGTFSSFQTLPTFHQTYSVALGDVDGDGDLDAFMGNNNQASIVWKNRDGIAPTVTINQAAGQSDPANALPLTFDVVFSEAVTGFGAGDLVRTGTATGGTLNVSGSGTTYTVTLTGTVNPGTVTLAVAAGAAVDPAGNPSLASTSTDNTVTVSTAVTGVNPAANSHTAPVGTNIQATFDQALNPATVTDATFVVHGMQTGRLETADGDSFGTSGATVTVNPFADFHAGELVQVTATGGIRNDSGVVAIPRVWQFRTAATSTGTGSFSNPQGLSPSHSVALGDVDGDGDLDVFLGGRNPLGNAVWKNNGSGVFTDSGQALGNHNTYSVALGDVDGDGDLDAFTGNSGGSRVWRNDGGTFTSLPPLTNHTTRSVALGDVDGDGDLDAFMGNNNQASLVWKNNGSGTFTLSQTLTSHLTRSVALGDVDGDGDLDAFQGNYGEPSIVWKNDGSGTFTSLPPLTSHNTYSVALGDVDGDGDLDAFMGNFNQASLVWTNNGSGTFTSLPPLTSHATRSVALGDVDGDGDLDSFMGNGIGQGTLVWKNDGSGNFSSSQTASSSNNTFSVALGDVDGDGDLDASMGNGTGQGTFVWKNQDAVAPTADVTNVSPDPRNSAVASITIVFSEAVSGFDLADLSLTRDGGGNLLTGSQTLTTSDNVTWTLGNLASLTAVAGSYQLTLTAAGSGIADLAANALTGNASDSWVVELTAPTVTINQAAGQPDPTNALPLTFDVVFSEVVIGFDAADLVRTGTSTGGTLNVSGSGNAYTVTLTGAVTAGTVTLAVAAGAATDAAGNASTASTSTDNTVTYDNLAPTADVTDVSPDPRNSAVGSISIVFSEAVSGFDLADLSLTRDGGANLLTGSQTLTSADNVTWTLGNLAGLTAAAGSYQLTLTAAGSGIQDGVGNALAGNASDIWVVDLTAPTVTINQAAGQADPTNALPLTFDVVFSEVVTGFDAADLVRTGTSTGGTLNVSGSGAAYTVTLSGAVTAGTVTLTVAAGAAVDAVGNASTASTSTDNTVTYDVTAPTADVTDVSPDPRTSAVASISIVFSEAVGGFDLADLSLTRDAGANLLTGSQTLTSADNVTWTLGNLGGLTAAAGSYQLTLTAAGSGITDLAGNALAGNASDSWVMDVTVLTVTINQAAGQADPTNVSPVQFTVVFSEPVTGFDASDLSFTGSTAPGSLTPFVNGSGTTYTVMVNGMTGSGTVVASVNAGAAINASSDANLASTSSDNSVTFDNVAPTVTINQAVGQSDPTNVLPLTFTVVFSEPVTGFAAGGLIRTGTSTGGTLNVSGSGGSGTTYTVTLSGAVTPGTVILTVAAGAAADAAGNGNSASTSTDNSVAYDNVAPTVTINQAAGQADPTNAGPIQFTVVFSEAVTDFDDPADIDLSGSTASGSLSALITPINSTTYTVSVSGMTGSGTVVASVVAGAALDSAGNASIASTGTDNTVTYDNVAPAVTINQAATQADPAKVQPIHFTVIFSEAINAATFTDADVTLTGTAGGLAGVSKLVSLVSGNIYNVAVSGLTSDGTVIASIAAGMVQDLAGNGNSASTSTDNTVTLDTTAPTVVAINPAGPNPTNASPVQFTVVFSETVTGFDAGDVSFTGSTAPGSLQAAVSGSGTSYTVAVFGMTGSGTVVVSVNAGAASDAAGNASAASGSASVFFDNGAPTADVVDVAPDPRTSAVSTLTIVFSEVVNGFNLADLSLTRDGGANLLTGSQTLTDGGNGTWTLGNLAALTSPTGTYQLTLTAAGSGIADVAGNALAGNASDNWMTDATPPTADVVDVTPDLRKDAVASITLVFTEAVSGFDLADLQLSHDGGANLLPGGATLTSGDNITWILGNLAGLTAAAGNYTLTLIVAGSGITDQAGNVLAGSASDGWIVNLNRYAVGQGTGGAGRAMVLNALDNSEHFRVTPYAVAGPVRVAMGDVNGDGTADLITAPAKGQLGTVKVFNGLDGTQLAGALGSFVPFAGWTKGLFVAAGDTNSDGRAEILVGQDKGGGQVKVFNGTTGTWTLLKALKPFGGTYKSGVTVAAGDTDNDGQAELISGRLVGATQVRIHEVASGTRVQTMTAFSGLNSGVYVAAGDIDGDGRDEVFAGLASGSLGLVKVLNPTNGTEINSTLALGSAFTGGLRVGATDRNGDGRAEMLVAAGPSATGGPRLEVLDGTTLAELDAIFADDNPAFAGGVFVG